MFDVPGYAPGTFELRTFFKSPRPTLHVASGRLHRDDGRGQGGRQVLQVQRFADQVAVAGDGAASTILQHQAGAARGVERIFRPRQVAGEHNAVECS